MIISIKKIKLIQKLLGVEIDGICGPHTRAAIKNFNLRNSKKSSDILDDDTYNDIIKKLGNESIESEEFYNSVEDSDTSDSEFTTDLIETDASYELYMLKPTEYVTDQGKILNKEYIFLHHTAGWHNPFRTIDDWNTDNRGRIATHFVIGGTDLRNGNQEHDGRIVKCIPYEYFGWHLGSTSKDQINFRMHTHSIGLEICNMGWLTERNGSFFTYTGARVASEYVEDLGFSFRGYRYWHKYTERQIDSVYILCKTLARKYEIDLNNGLKNWLNNSSDSAAFNFNIEARDGKIKGLLSHTNVRRDKTDVSPQKLLVDMIKSL